MSFSISKRWHRFYAEYDNGLDTTEIKENTVDVDKEIAVIVKAKEDLTIYAKKEMVDKWVTIDVPAKSLYRIDASKYEAMNVFRTDVGDPVRVSIKSLGRSFGADESVMDDQIDTIEAKRSFEWLEPFTIA